MNEDRKKTKAGEEQVGKKGAPEAINKDRETEMIGEWESQMVAWLNDPPERTRPSVVVPRPAYLDRTIDDRERFMQRARPKITKDILKEIIRGEGGVMGKKLDQSLLGESTRPVTRLGEALLTHDVMRNCFVSQGPDNYVYVPISGAGSFNMSDMIEVPIGVDEPTWWPGRDGGGGGGGGQNASDDPADIVYMPITYEEFLELLQLLFDLPFLKQTAQDKMLVYTIKMRGLKRTGPMVRMDKKATAIARLERFRSTYNAHPDRFPDLNPDDNPTVEEFPFHKVDLRYKRVEERWDPDSRAVVFMNLDVSGSMGGEPLAIAKFYFLLNLIWLRTRYNDVSVVYIAHNARAERIRSEKDFFRVGENGGTMFCPTYELSWQIANTEFGGDDWNKYCLHATDGYGFDGEREIGGWIEKLVRGGFNYFGYCEINLYGSWGGGMITPGMRAVTSTAPDVRKHCGWARISNIDEVPEAMMKIMTGDRTTET